MPLMPKRVKHRKFQRGSAVKGKATRCNYVAFGEYGLQALEPAWITAEQIEAARLAVTHYLHGEGKFVNRIFPHRSITGKPAETRQGKGKGDITHWVAVVKEGTVMFELGGVPHEHAVAAFARVAMKMPIRTRLITRRVQV
jgi:large subunit ribosomal protein L16